MTEFARVGEYETQNLTLVVYGGTPSTWRAVAEHLNFLCLRGPNAGRGNISALLDAIITRRVSGAELEAAIQTVTVHEEATDGST